MAQYTIKTFYDFFSSGTLENFEVNSATIVTDETHRGDYAVFTGDQEAEQAQFRVNPFDSPVKPVYVNFWSYETSSSGGNGYRVRNSDGDWEMGVACDNPNIDLDDANGVETDVLGTGYEGWWRATTYFDWERNTFDIEIEQPSQNNYVFERNRPLKVGKDLEQFEFWAYHGYEEGELGSEENWGGWGVHCWWDSIEVVL